MHFVRFYKIRGNCIYAFFTKSAEIAFMRFFTLFVHFSSIFCALCPFLHFPSARKLHLCVFYRIRGNCIYAFFTKSDPRKLHLCVFYKIRGNLENAIGTRDAFFDHCLCTLSVFTKSAEIAFMRFLQTRGNCIYAFFTRAPGGRPAAGQLEARWRPAGWLALAGTVCQELTEGL